MRVTIIKAIQKARSSIFLVTFGLSDLSILEALETKAAKNLPMKIFYDRRGSSHISLSNNKAIALKPSGFVHQKILIVDGNTIFIGSANMTKSSLLMHDNFVIGLFSPTLANWISSHAPLRTGHLSTLINQQKMEFWLLPDQNHRALRMLKYRIQAAKKSIHLAMFTLTHPLLVKELIIAKRRGIDVRIYLDSQSIKGASKTAFEHLKKANIPILHCKEQKLLHHKFVLIDKETLICGSTNWTKAAFNKNHDCLMMIHHLKEKQKSFMNKIIHALDTY